MYGFAELAAGQLAVRGAERVANPGCYATGAIALLRPWSMARLPPTRPEPALGERIPGGGRSMIEATRPARPA